MEGTNKLLKKICLKQGYTYIDNDSLDATCLNGSKLHVNAKGSALLAVHFIKFLRSGKNPRRSVGDFPKKVYNNWESCLWYLCHRQQRTEHADSK